MIQECPYERKVQNHIVLKGRTWIWYFGDGCNKSSMHKIIGIRYTIDNDECTKSFIRRPLSRVGSHQSKTLFKEDVR